MIALPPDCQNTACVIGIDPGSTMLGVGVIYFDIATRQIVSSLAWSINSAKMTGADTWAEELHGARFSRISTIEKYLTDTFACYAPLFIACESPFINNKFPMSGLALTEVVCSIRRAVITYDVWKELSMVPPSLVKNAVKAPGGCNKDVMKEKIMALPDLHYCGPLPLQNLDEHGVDGLAVAYYKIKSLWE